MDLTNQATRVEQLRFWIDTLPECIIRMPEEELSFKPNPKKWSKKEILGHLIDSAVNNWRRFALAKRSEGVFVITPYPQDYLVEVNGYQSQTIDDIVRTWKQLNKRIYYLITNFSEEELQKQVETSTENVNNLGDLARDYVDHLEHHLKQIFPFQEQAAELPSWQLGLFSSEQALKNVPETFITLMASGSMLVELYKPERKDLQQPHKQDELYVVISGTGIFRREEQLTPFGPGDVLFVPAGEIHRFESFTEDFQTWVIFYGPEGGEKFSN